ncbi:hypothetical protein [Streptomyces globisporus]|uniref:hypothetical protein n=1 Tax=Streptomyces globisporus TaxID=1908 RepID=UPI0004C7333D|nr:hypothetical protein [Streptomyces globisporus]
MSARESYGTRPEYIAEVLALLGEDALLLSYEEQRAFAEVSLDRFEAIGSGRLDWRGAEVVEKREDFGGGALAALLGAHAAPDELVIVFWDNLLVPTIGTTAALAARHADAIVDQGPVFWLFLADEELLIEFQDGEAFRVGRPPAAEDRRTRDQPDLLDRLHRNTAA